MTDPVQKPREFGLYIELGQVGLEMVAPIVLGYFLDRWLGTLPWISIGGVILGFVGGLIHLNYLLKRWDRSGPSNSRDAS